jgi:hypothetical protein
MRSIIGCCLLALLLTASAAAENAAILRGTVRSAHTGQPIAGAIIMLQSASVTFSGRTDRRGFFSLMGVPGGPARMQVQAEGYTGVVFPICVQADVSRTLALVLAPGGSLPQLIGAQKRDEEAATRLNADITSDLYEIGPC